MPQRADRGWQIVEDLATKVRLYSVCQLAAEWWSGAAGALRRADAAVRRLEAEGLVESHLLLSEPPLDLDAPIYAWAPGDAEPPFERGAWLLQSRWDPPVRTRVVVATTHAKTLRADGSRGGLLYPSQANHDLHVSQLFLRFRRVAPDRAAAWVSEDLRPKAGFRVKDPDVILDLDDGPLVVEFGGRYDARRLRDLHAHCADRDLRYELW
jgi:hypothetical protein